MHIGATAFLGVAIAPLSSFRSATAAAGLVTSVLSGSPADRAGLAPGDVIISFDGRAVRSAPRSSICCSANARETGSTSPGSTVSGVEEPRPSRSRAGHPSSPGQSASDDQKERPAQLRREQERDKKGEQRDGRSGHSRAWLAPRGLEAHDSADVDSHDPNDLIVPSSRTLACAVAWPVGKEVRFCKESRAGWSRPSRFRLRVVLMGVLYWLLCWLVACSPGAAVSGNLRSSHCAISSRSSGAEGNGRSTRPPTERSLPPRAGCCRPSAGPALRSAPRRFVAGTGTCWESAEAAAAGPGAPTRDRDAQADHAAGAREPRVGATCASRVNC